LLRCAARGVVVLLAAGVALSLLATPLHRALEHDHDPAQTEHSHGHESKAHHCPVCALAKGQLDTPNFIPTTVVFLRGEVVLPVIEFSCSAASRFDLLPPGRAPPVSVIPS
jgi:hypothetical protein